MKQLHLNYCGIDETAGTELANLLSNVRSALEILSLGGNSLKGRGLELVCKGLSTNTLLKKINLSDNKIDQSNEDAIGLTALKDALLTPTVGLESVNLLYNRIGRLRNDNVFICIAINIILVLMCVLFYFACVR